MQTMLSQLPIFAGRTRVITHVSGWLLLAFIFFYFLSGVRDTQEALLRTLVNLAFMLVLFYGNAYFLVYRYLERGQFRAFFYTAATALLVLSALLRTWIEFNWFGGSVFELNNNLQDGAWRMFLGYLISFLLLLVFSTLYKLVENRRILELQHLELSARHQEAQLNYLKAQINPHFLFNTLHNIYAAAVLQHPRTAEMVLRLSDLLRYVTYEAKADKVPLEKEMAQIAAYIALFQLKSEGTLPVHATQKGDLSSWQIEPLLLLPLVENALKHGNLDTDANAFLNTVLEVSPDHLYFWVENSFDSDNLQKDETGGVGLENVRHRLNLHYGTAHQFSAGPEGKKYRADIHLYRKPVV
jgi:hypothetical protein